MAGLRLGFDDYSGREVAQATVLRWSVPVRMSRTAAGVTSPRMMPAGSTTAKGAPAPITSAAKVATLSLRASVPAWLRPGVAG